uniref:dolichol kinase n=1 Tax=Alona affinis TaxID=381656 RepID=A0A9N6ZDP7_9CRUS|nr:EOG090X0BFL [Alona affinis]
MEETGEVQIVVTTTAEEPSNNSTLSIVWNHLGSLCACFLGTVGVTIVFCLPCSNLWAMVINIKLEIPYFPAYWAYSTSAGLLQDSADYCQFLLYKFAFWLLNCCFIVMGSVLIIIPYIMAIIFVLSFYNLFVTLVHFFNFSFILWECRTCSQKVIALHDATVKKMCQHQQQRLDNRSELTRQRATATLIWILPAALVLSSLRYYDHVSVGYMVGALCSVVSSIYLNLSLFNCRPVTAHILSSTLALYFLRYVILILGMGIFLTLLIFYWAMKLTILRKYFHGVVVAIYLPGILMDAELLFTASVIALAAFMLLEAVRIYNLEGLGAVLQNSMAGFLDEKDQGSLILTHIYLLVGCSLPVWIFPETAVTSASEILLLCSGVISLGIGDAAASIGGSLYGKTKWPGSEKSIEGTAFSIAAELVFVGVLQIFGVFGSWTVPWLRYLITAVATSLVEAHTTQVDNLVLPLVMYIFMVI